MHHAIGTPSPNSSIMWMVVNGKSQPFVPWVLSQQTPFLANFLSISLWNGVCTISEKWSVGKTCSPFASSARNLQNSTGLWWPISLSHSPIQDRTFWRAYALCKLAKSCLSTRCCHFDVYYPIFVPLLHHVESLQQSFCVVLLVGEGAVMSCFVHDLNDTQKHWPGRSCRHVQSWSTYNLFRF